MLNHIFALRDDTRSKEADEFVRKNGFSLPLQVFQLMSFVIYIVIILLILGITAFSTEAMHIYCYVLFGLLIVSIFILSYIVTKINPVDPLSFKYINKNCNDEEVKDLYHCDVCGYVDSKSKHCKVCNKCVSVFDHHCMWVNNCIGAKNYKFFVALLSVLTLLNCFVFFFCILFFITSLNGDTIKTSWTKTYGSYNGIVFYLLLGILFALNIVVFVLVIQLFGLHLFLIKKNMTTYEYILNRVHESEKKEKKSIRTFFEWIIIDKKRLENSKNKNKDIENQEIERDMTVKKH